VSCNFSFDGQRPWTQQPQSQVQTHPAPGQQDQANPAPGCSSSQTPIFPRRGRLQQQFGRTSLLRAWCRSRGHGRLLRSCLVPVVEGIVGFSYRILESPGTNEAVSSIPATCMRQCSPLPPCPRAARASQDGTWLVWLARRGPRASRCWARGSQRSPWLP